MEKREQSVPVSDSVARGPLVPIQAQNDGSGCSDRGEPTNESLPNGSTPIGSRRRRDGGATSVFVAFDSAGKNRTGPRGELSPKRARDSCSDRCSTDARQEHSNQRYSRGRGRGRDTGWNNLRLQRQQKCTGRAAASWCSCAPPVCPNLPCALHLVADGPPVNCFLPGGLLRSFSNTLAMGPQSIHPAGQQRAFCFQQRPPSAAPLCVPI